MFMKIFVKVFFQFLIKIKYGMDTCNDNLLFMDQLYNKQKEKVPHRNISFCLLENIPSQVHLPKPITLSDKTDISSYNQPSVNLPL